MASTMSLALSLQPVPTTGTASLHQHSCKTELSGGGSPAVPGHGLQAVNQSISADSSCLQYGGKWKERAGPGTKLSSASFLNLFQYWNEAAEKIRHLPVWSQNTERRQKAGHRSAASWEASQVPGAHSSAHLALPDGGMLKAGRLWGKCSLFLAPGFCLPCAAPLNWWQSPVHHHCMEQLGAGTMGGGTALALCSSSHSLLSQA